MLKHNSLINGLILGFLIPLAGYVLLTGIFQGIENMRDAIGDEIFSTDFRRRTFAIVAIGLNAIPMNIAYKRKQTDTMRGIVIPTFIFVGIWLWRFGKFVF